MDFTDAVEHCRQREGWQLAAIESHEEYLAISEKLKQSKFFHVTFEKKKSRLVP